MAGKVRSGGSEGGKGKQSKRGGAGPRVLVPVGGVRGRNLTGPIGGGGEGGVSSRPRNTERCRAGRRTLLAKPVFLMCRV